MVIRKVDFDTGAEKPPGGWSVANLGLPLPMVGVLLLQTVGLVFWLGRYADKLETVIEQNKEIKAEMYKTNDSARDLALRDDRISELGRRIEILERYVDGRRK